MQSHTRSVIIWILVAIVVIGAIAVGFVFKKTPIINDTTSRGDQSISVFGTLTTNGNALSVALGDGASQSCIKTSFTSINTPGEDKDKVIKVGDIIHAWSQGSTTPSNLVVVRGITLVDYLNTLPERAREINFNGEVVTVGDKTITVRSVAGTDTQIKRDTIKNLSISNVSTSTDSGIKSGKVRMSCVKKSNSVDFEATSLTFL